MGYFLLVIRRKLIIEPNHLVGEKALCLMFHRYQDSYRIFFDFFRHFWMFIRYLWNFMKHFWTIIRYFLDFIRHFWTFMSHFWKSIRYFWTLPSFLPLKIVKIHKITKWLLASQSDAHRIAPHRDPNPRPRPIPLIALKQERPMM